MPDLMRVLVVGATGRIGREVLAQLPRSEVRIRALVRNPGTAALPPDVEAALGDLTRPETLERCLDGVDAVFLVWTAPLAAAGPALERITARAKRVVFLSSPYKTTHLSLQQPDPGRVLHAEIERRIEDSGCEWTFLRPGMFAANALGWWAPRIRAGVGTVRWPYAAAPTAPIDERDVAAAAVRVLREEGHAGAEYVLRGPSPSASPSRSRSSGTRSAAPCASRRSRPEHARTELAGLLPLRPSWRCSSTPGPRRSANRRS